MRKLLAFLKIHENYNHNWNDNNENKIDNDKIDNRLQNRQWTLR